MAIDYVAYNNSGARVTGVLDVETEAEAEEKLWADGLIIVDLKHKETAKPETWYHKLLPTVFGTKLGDTITFTRQLETLLRAGVPLHRALRQLRDESRSIGMRYATNRVMQDIENGERFSRALARHPRVFPSFYLRMIPMAEQTGELPRVLRDLVYTMERQQKVATQARSAIMAPSISLLVGFIAAFVLFTFVLPRLVELLGEFGTDLPRATRILVGLSEFSRDWGTWVVIGLVSTFAAVFLFFTRTPYGKYQWHGIMLRLPVIGPVVRSSTMFDISSMFALLLQTGVAPVGALRAVAGTIGNIRIREAFTRVDADVTEGQRLGASLMRYPVVPRLFSETVANGEQAGALATNLQALADFYQEDTERRVQTGTALIEPIAFIVVGSMIGFVAVAVISGIYSVIPQIGASI